MGYQLYERIEVLMDFVNYFDDRVINILYAVTQVSIAVIFLLIYSVYKKKYLNKITVGFSLNAIGIFLITMRQYIPNFASILVGNVLLIVGLYIVYDAMVEMISGKENFKRMLRLGFLFGITHLIFVYILPDVRLRIVNYSIFAILGAIYLILEYIKSLYNHFESILLIVVVSHIIQVGFLLTRIINAVADQDMQILFSNSNILKYFILYSILLSIIRVISVIMYNTKDLVNYD